MPFLTPASEKELQKALAKCGECRLKLDALKAAGFPVDDELEALDQTENKATILLREGRSEKSR